MAQFPRRPQRIAVVVDVKLSLWSAIKLRIAGIKTDIDAKKK